jgi:subtilisin family serine protease
MDGFSARHGTAVAAIALNSYYRSSDTTSLPKLMVVKVLNDEGAGTVFDLCCGLHYATRNHATVINASLGYFQSDASVNENEVLEYYLAKCRADSIPVIAAAGNTGEIENRDLLCMPNTTGSNRMSATNMFLPASYAQDPDKFSVISVTGLGKPGIPCYYQNFSEQFVTMGVLNMGAETNCCSYKLPFFFRAVDGTSYAAPVVSGRLAFKIARLGHHSSLDQYLSEMNVQRAPNAAGMLPASHANQYITY